MALADVNDALVSRRVYLPAYPHEQAIDMMDAILGFHFDPVVLDAFLAAEANIQAIAKQFSDGD